MNNDQIVKRLDCDVKHSNLLQFAELLRVKHNRLSTSITKGCSVKSCIFICYAFCIHAEESDYLGDQVDTSRYCERVFGFDSNSHEFQWCFDLLWQNIDDTLLGVYARIRHMLKAGIPPDFINLGVENYINACKCNIKTIDYMRNSIIDLELELGIFNKF